MAFPSPAEAAGGINPNALYSMPRIPAGLTARDLPGFDPFAGYKQNTWQPSSQWPWLDPHMIGRPINAMGGSGVATYQLPTKRGWELYWNDPSSHGTMGGSQNQIAGFYANDPRFAPQWDLAPATGGPGSLGDAFLKKGIRGPVGFVGSAALTGGLGSLMAPTAGVAAGGGSEIGAAAASPAAESVANAGIAGQFGAAAAPAPFVSMSGSTPMSSIVQSGTNMIGAGGLGRALTGPLTLGSGLQAGLDLGQLAMRAYGMANQPARGGMPAPSPGARFQQPSLSPAQQNALVSFTPNPSGIRFQRVY